MSNNENPEQYYCLSGGRSLHSPTAARSSQLFACAGTLAGSGPSMQKAPIGFRYDVNAGWLNIQLKTVQELRKLPVDWNSYGADPPNHKAAYWCEETLREMNALRIWDGRVSPSGEGGIAIVFRHSEKYADIEFLNDSSILAVKKSAGNPSEAWEISADKDSLKDALEEIRLFLGT